jgi:chromosome segregation protein
VKHVAQLGVILDETPESVLPQLASMIENLQSGTNEAEGAVAVLIASQAANQIVDVERELAAAREQLAGAEKALSTVGRSEGQLKEASQTIKPVQGELVDEQLAALSPLLVELYERLRPHVDWRRVRYVLRGDVRRMLSLEVGTGLNPNFMFSSGQRRAAGLAFLLAIFLSRSWCKLRTLMLDDPVQHVDDYRALHLTEVLAAVRRAGHQIVCTVEDRALAELLARRLRSDFDDQGALIELAYEPGRGSRIAQSRSLAPLTPRVLVAS